MSLLYTLLADQPHADVLADMDDSRWRDMRKTIINAIIHTDMVHHFPMVSKVGGPCVLSLLSIWLQRACTHGT